MEIIEYSPELLEPWAALHNATFAGCHNFWPVSSRVLKRRVAQGGPGFEAALLLFARHEGELVGFAHGGREPAVYAIGVRPDARRGGIGAALLRELRRRLGAHAPFDTRVLNPFWGNAAGPETSFFGMVEGIGLAADDTGSRAFFAAMGAKSGPNALNLRVGPNDVNLARSREARTRAEAQDYQFALLYSRCPVVGAGAGSERPFRTKDWFAATAMTGDEVAGTSIAFATPELGPGRFGIFSLEVSEAHRRKGLGSALVGMLLLEMQQGPFACCEVTTVPADSPGALELYQQMGFTECAEFALFA